MGFHSSFRSRRPSPPSAPVATAFALSGPTTGATGVAQTYTVTPNAALGGTVVVTPAATNSGSVSPSSLTFNPGSSVAQTFTVTRSTDGASDVSITNNGGLANTGTPIGLTTSSGSDVDWIARSTAAGVLFADRLDTTTNWTPSGTVDATHYVLADGSQDHISLETTIKASPYAAGSMKFAVLNTDGPSSGNAAVPLPSSRGQGTTTWFSYRRYAPHAHAYNPWCANGTAPKSSILSHVSGSNQVNEVVATVEYNLINGYHQNGSGSPGQEQGASTACSGSDFLWQFDVDNGAGTLTGNNPDTGSAWSSCEQAARQYGGLYSRKSAAEVRQGFGDPLSGGFREYAGEWVTITKRVVVGTWGASNSRITTWAARDGQPYVLLADEKNVQLGSGPDYNRLWLLPYVTGRSPGGRKVTSVGGSIAGVTVRGCGQSTFVGDGTLEYVQSTGRFRFKAANDNYGTARGFSVANGITKINLSSSSDAVQSTLNGGVTLPQSTIALASTAGFPTGGGSVTIGYNDSSGSGNGEQHIAYTGVSGNSLTGCTGGTGTKASGDPVMISSFVVLSIDTPASLPGSGTTTAAVTVAEGREDTAVYYNDVILSSAAINAPGGFGPVDSDGTALAQAAAGMVSGDWLDFTMGSLTNATLVGGGGATNAILNGFGQRMVWDPLHRKLQFVGTQHTGGADVAGAGGKATWDDASNQWSRQSYTWSAGGGTGPGHAYNHLAVDPNNGNLYFRGDNSRLVWKWTYAADGSGAWNQSFSTIGHANYGNQFAGGLCWLQGLNSGAGGLVFCDTLGAAWSNAALSSWTGQAGSSTSGGYSNWACEAGGKVYFGGGHDYTYTGDHLEVYAVDSSGTVTTKANSPIVAGTADAGVVLTHPNGTDLVLFEHLVSGGRIWTFNGTSWSTHGTHQLGTTDGAWMGCAIPEYGVFVTVSMPGSSGTPTCKLYKP